MYRYLEGCLGTVDMMMVESIVRQMMKKELKMPLESIAGLK